MLVLKPNQQMANKTIDMSKLRQILRHYAQGKGKKQISLLTGVSRNTIKKYIRRFISEKLTFEVIHAMTDHELDLLFGKEEERKPDNRYEALQQLLPGMHKQMARKGAMLTLLWKEYRQQYPDGYQLTQYCKYYRQFVRGANPVMHIEHKPGDKMYVDYAGEKLCIIDRESGEVREVEVFAAILGCSQLTYVEALYSQKREDFVKGCENALHFYGGVPAAIVPDNLKSAVTKSSRYEPTLNETFADFAEHYGTAVLPARAYRPKDKALVEGVVKIIYRRIYTALYDRTFFTLDELNAAIWEELAKHNSASFKGRNYSRQMQFEEIEKQTLQALPAYRYEFKLQQSATVMKNGHVGISIDKHYYSVPYRFIGRKIKILFTDSKVEVFYHYELIASHSRNRQKYRYTTNQEHLASSHRYLSEWTPEKFIEQGLAIHEEVANYIARVIEAKTHPEQAYKSCSGILSLVRKAGKERLTNACRRAHSYGVYNYPIIEQILTKNYDQMEEEDPAIDLTMPLHNNVRGNNYYE